MKKNILLLTSVLLSFSIASCGNGNVTSDSAVTPSDESTVSSVTSDISSSESGVDTPFEEKELAAMIDYASQLQFDPSSGRKYVEVDSIKLLIDGDTTHFNLGTTERAAFTPSDDAKTSKLTTSTDGILKVRYLGIDTPESTGSVEEWGKTASKFNKSRLSEATSVIVESGSDIWEVDSTGTRVLGFVWYKTADMDTYKNLNLEILQEGYSYAKNLSTLCYSEAFQNAYNQALTHELHVFAKKASMWQFNADNNAITDSNGYVVGSTKSNKTMISFKQENLENINSVSVYNSKGNSVGTTSIASNIENDPAYTLGMKVDGETYYFTGEIEKGLGSITTDKEKALNVHIEKDSSKTGYYNIYYTDENEVKNYFTINSSGNIDYMQRDQNYYYGAYLETTIKGLRENPTDYEQKLVRFEGIVAYNSEKTYYVQQYDEESGLYYGVQVYVGYNFSSGESLLAVGNEVSICGTYSLYEAGGTYQVSGLYYMAMKPKYEKNTRVISMGNEVAVKEITAADLNNTEASDLYNGISYAQTLMNTRVSMKNLTVTKVYTTGSSSASAGAMTLTCRDESGNTCTIRTEVIYKEGSTLATEADFKGKSINVTSGIVDYYSDSYQVRVFSYNDFSFND